MRGKRGAEAGLRGGRSAGSGAGGRPWRGAGGSRWRPGVAAGPALSAAPPPGGFSGGNLPERGRPAGGAAGSAEGARRAPCGPGREARTRPEENIPPNIPQDVPPNIPPKPGAAAAARPCRPSRLRQPLCPARLRQRWAPGAALPGGGDLGRVGIWGAAAAPRPPCRVGKRVVKAGRDLRDRLVQPPLPGRGFGAALGRVGGCLGGER